MLSDNMQKLILKMYIKYITTGNGDIARKEVSDIYTSRVSFYRGMKYLIDSGYVDREEIKINMPIFRLSVSGQLLARLLCSMQDNPKEIRHLASSILF